MGMLKEQLSLQAHELKNYRDKVLRLQDQLIQVGEKNENEKRMLRKHNKPVVVPSSCDLERQLEAKVAKVRSLEEAYRKQEKVIEKMEMLLRMQNISKAKRTERRMEELEKENALLRKRLIEMKDESCSPCPCSQPRQSPQHTIHSLDGSSQPHHPPHTPHHPSPHRHHHHHHHSQSSRKQHQQGKPLPVDSFQDYLEMKEKFYQAEAKIKQLENQINENKEEWTSEKTKLMNLLKSNKEGDGFCLCSRKKFVRPPRHFQEEYEEPLRSFDSEDNSSIHHHHHQQDHHHNQHPKDHHHHQQEDRHHLHQDHLHDYLQQQQHPHDYHRPRGHHRNHHLRRRHPQLQKLQQFQKCPYPCCEPTSRPSSTTFTNNNNNELQGHVRQQQPFFSPRRFEQH